ncbi:MAG: lipoyl protein ligase domain-containing protein, partial [Acidimicrobiales bacterium]
MVIGTGWSVERVAGGAGALHVRDPWEGGPSRRVWLCRPTGTALVLGSTQPEGDADLGRAGAAGVAVVRRRSGGGAVLVTAEMVWVDIALPAGDPLAETDVGRAFWWVGQVWASAIESLGLGPAVVHRRALARTPWSTRLCFAGLGPGEVTVEGRKVVGLSQRRTRAGSVFHGAAYLTFDPAALPALLAMGGADRQAATAALAAAAG